LFLSNNQKAINDYDQAIALNPKDASFFVSRGAVYASLNEYQKAINDYDQAIALDPKNAEVFVDRGVAYYR
jgi:tetratricopeptide (TPR) repeat protein